MEDERPLNPETGGECLALRVSAAGPDPAAIVRDCLVE